MGVCCVSDQEGTSLDRPDATDLSKNNKPKFFGETVHGGDDSEDSDDINDPIESKSLRNITSRN